MELTGSNTPAAPDRLASKDHMSCSGHDKKRLLMVLLGPVRVCVCDLCVKASRADLVYTPGCRCDVCRRKHRFLHLLVDGHANQPGAKVYVGPASGWPEGHATVYAAVPGEQPDEVPGV